MCVCVCSYCCWLVLGYVKISCGNQPTKTNRPDKNASAWTLYRFVEISYSIWSSGKMLHVVKLNKSHYLDNDISSGEARW